MGPGFLDVTKSCISFRCQLDGKVSVGWFGAFIHNSIPYAISELSSTQSTMFVQFVSYYAIHYSLLNWGWARIKSKMGLFIFTKYDDKP